MELTEEDIQKFRDIWIQEFGEDIGMDQARIEAYNLLELAWVIMQPLPGEPG